MVYKVWNLLHARALCNWVRFDDWEPFQYFYQVYENKILIYRY